jgi:hypothetical protein
LLLLLSALCTPACFDLFHRTLWVSRCDDDPSHEDCVGDAGAPGGGGQGAGGIGGDGVAAGASSGSSSSATSAGGASSTGAGGAADDVGCADGLREGFPSSESFPDIAACAGGWSLPGVQGPAPVCGHAAGDDGENPSGVGCSAADVCSAGWHVCATREEVTAKGGCAAIEAPVDSFFVTGQSGAGSAICGAGANDLFGCGTLGLPPTDCAPLDRFSNDLCMALGAPWTCGPDNATEAQSVTKPSSARGGVLCCRE